MPKYEVRTAVSVVSTVEAPDINEAARIARDNARRHPGAEVRSIIQVEPPIVLPGAVVPDGGGK